MSTHVILDEFRDRTGWNTQSCLIIVSDYIDAQQSDDAYLSHLFEAAEGDIPDSVATETQLIEHQGWSEKTQLSLMLDYIEAQEAHDAFRDHLSEAEDQEKRMTLGG